MKKLFCVVDAGAITDVKLESAMQSSRSGVIMTGGHRDYPSFPDIWAQLADKLQREKTYYIAGYETYEEAKEAVKQRMKGASVYANRYAILEMIAYCEPVKTEDINISEMK